MTIWLAVLTTAVVLTLLAIVGHHVWELRRDGDAINRHETVMKAIADQRALTLAAISQRDALASRVQKLEARLDRADRRDGAVPAGP